MSQINHTRRATFLKACGGSASVLSIAVVLATALGAGMASAQTAAEIAASSLPQSKMPQSKMPTARPVRPAAGSASSGLQVTTQSSPVKVQVLNLPKGRSAVIDLPVDASDVFVSNPASADAVLRTPRRIFVLGVDAGQSDAIFFDAMGRQILNLSIRVDAPVDQLSDTVHRLFPASHVEVQSLNGRVIISGLAQNNAEADQIYRLAQGFVAKPEDVVNLVSIAGQDQVTLKVRIVEVNRSTIKQLGFSTNAVLGQTGGVQYSIAQSATYGVNNKLVGGTTAGYNQDTTTQPIYEQKDALGNIIRSSAKGDPLATVMKDLAGSTGVNKITANLQAFERVGLVRTLAEPNLTTSSGEAAKFLAGGEFPVPVAQDNQGRVTVDYKPFGVGLGFTPVVMSSGRISLKISAEVSELSNIGALQLNTSLTLPALSVRRVQNTVEMQSGSSLMIAGLLQQKYKQSIDSLPGLTALPVLGTLFRSRDFLNDETELVVIVTPYIVSPTDPNAMQTPGDNLQIAHDMQTVFMGELNKTIKAKNGDKTPDSDAAPAYQAPVGYVIE